MNTLRLALRSLLRDLRSGEIAVLLLALTVAVASLTAVGFFTSRVSRAVTQQAGEVLAADLRLESARAIDERYDREATARGLRVARILSMPSVVFVGEQSSLITLRAASSGYPLRGRLKVAERPFGPAQPEDGIPARGEAWADSRLLAKLGAEVGSTLNVGATSFRVTRVLDYRPDQGVGFADLSSTLLVNLDDVPATGLIQPGSRVSRAVLFAGDPRPVESFREWLEASKQKGERLKAVADASPQIRSSSDRAGRFLSLASIVAVLLSAIAVAMSARRYASRHLDTAALMKCMGASQREVLAQSLVQLGVIAVAVAAAGTVLGYLAQTGLAQAAVQLKEGHPDRYTVAKGDTLWDISGKFLSQPWKWPELWHANPQIENPHLIYPGDTLSLVYIDGQPRLMLNRGESRGTIKLSPQVRSTPLAQAIPTIPLGAINSFLISNRIVDTAEDFSAQPYVVAGNQESVISGAGDRIYARGSFEDNQAVYGIFRQGKTYTDPETKEILGINADDIGSAELISEEGDIATLNLSRTTQEVRPGDRLFPTEERAVNSTFMPSEPPTDVDGVILDVPRGVNRVGQFDVVTINKGKIDGLSEGNVLAVYKTGETVRDRITGESVKVPDERSGLLMVFRTYEKLSYGLVLYATRDLALMDKVKNP